MVTYYIINFDGLFYVKGFAPRRYFAVCTSWEAASAVVRLLQL